MVQSSMEIEMGMTGIQLQYTDPSIPFVVK